ncbi:hypothetical protein CP973_00205 [Streptomyces albofaciens JCM 4342]|uniref:hypothetical protein n=1 Tax=Streptomyces albofaciens TaxID=66866 RepID=UPI001238F984|nr:hypothetical protein [Streptomyces albofaciens]KAA6215126.1 hypothetical protein CP973_39790 [Streptomyces albofaciens JCM 4342]KAA6220625.1 hypothetical protein CP973_00205 [Streptomyces albofaciens JCM 4342]
MNRNKKHPDRIPHRRRGTTPDRTKNTRGFLVTGSWDQRPDHPAVKPTSDRAAARRIARDMADKGAYVIVEEHRGHGQWRTLYEVDGPTLLADRRRAADEERRRIEEEQRAAAAAEAARVAAAEQAARDRDALARLMVRPPVARDQCGRRDARHVTGAQR